MKVQYTVRMAQEDDVIYASTIARMIEAEARNDQNGICKRSAEMIEEKIRSGDAIIAVTEDHKWLGFCYNQLWNDGYVSTCALIVNSKYRMGNVARHLKKSALEHAREKYPGKKYFGLTTSTAVMRINSALGYVPVTYTEVTHDENFWEACKTCSNYPVLRDRGRKNCLCTAMIYKNTKS